MPGAKSGNRGGGLASDSPHQFGGFEVFSSLVSLRFIQGYRYLDRCGECLIRLEDALESGWIPVETTPTSGSMKNESLGMGLSFNTEALTVRQTEFIRFDLFMDQACKIYDTVRRVLEINRINIPALQVLYQKGYELEQVDDAERHLIDAGLCTIAPELLSAMGGEQASIQFAVVTQVTEATDELPLERRRRLQANIVRQEKQVPFDQRLLSRSRWLGPKQRDAIVALQALRKQHPIYSPIAVQFEVEDSLDMELATADFNMRDFLVRGKQWADDTLENLVAKRRR